MSRASAPNWEFRFTPLIQPLVLFLLPLDVGTDHCLIPPNR